MPKHENIIGLHGVCKDEGVHIDRQGREKPAIFAVQEAAANGDLFDYVVAKPFDDNMTRMLARQLLSAVQHMKDNNYAHRDLKLENVSLDEDYRLKVIDFGFATPYIKGQLCDTYRGSASYMDPNIIARNGVDLHKADMFSIGVILYTLRLG